MLEALNNAGSIATNKKKSLSRLPIQAGNYMMAMLDHHQPHQ